MKKRNALSLFLAVLTAAALVSGCASSTQQSSAAPQSSAGASQPAADAQSAPSGGAASQPSKEMVYLTCITPQQSGYISMQRVIERYQSEVNPNLKVDMQYIADKPAYLQKFKTLIASNDMPDMSNVDASPYTNTLLRQGYLKNLDPIVEKYNLEDVFLAAPLSWGKTSDGVQVAIPIDYSIEVFWYNTKIFEKAGVTPPKTFSEFMDVCAKIKAVGETPIAVSGKEAWPILRYFDFVTYRYGDNQFLFDLARGKQKMSSEVGMRAVNFVYDLGTRGYFQSDFASTDYTGALDYFLGGNAAIYYMGTWDLPFFQDDQLSEDMKGCVDYFLLPTVDEGEAVGKNRFVAESSMPIGFSAAKFDDETERFIKFYADNISEATDGLAFSCAKAGKLPNDSSLTQRLAKDMEGAEGTINLYDVEMDPATNTLIGQEAVSLALGNITPEEFAARVDASIAENAPNFFAE